MPAGSLHDERVAIHYRMLRYNPVTDVGSVYYPSMQRAARRLGDRLRYVVPYTTQQVVESYAGRLRLRYQAAADSLLVKDLDVSDSFVKGFVKRDKTTPEKFLEKAPRIISPRDPRYGVLLARLIKPIEHKLFRMKDDFKLPLFAKQYNARQRYNIIEQKFNLFKNCTVTSIDAKAFDAHVTPEQLDLEHSVYLRYHRTPLFDKLLQWQKVNKVRLMHGDVVTLKGRRMSGDMNTAIGNCVIILCLLLGFIEFYGLEDHMTIFDDGDDCLIFTDELATPYLVALPDWFAALGHEMTIDNTTTDFDQILFCQSRPFSATRTMVRDWTKVLSHSFVSHKHYHSPKFGVKVMKSIAQAEISLNQGIPIIQSWFVAWQNKLADYNFVGEWVLEESLLRRISHNWMKCRPKDVTGAARELFFAQFGIAPEEQLHWESRLSRAVEAYDIQGYVNGNIMPTVYHQY